MNGTDRLVGGKRNGDLEYGSIHGLFTMAVVGRGRDTAFGFDDMLISAQLERTRALPRSRSKERDVYL